MSKNNDSQLLNRLDEVLVRFPRRQRPGIALVLNITAAFGPNGCWLADEQMAGRMSASTRTVGRIHKRLLLARLIEAAPHGETIKYTMEGTWKALRELQPVLTRDQKRVLVLQQSLYPEPEALIPEESKPKSTASVYLKKPLTPEAQELQTQLELARLEFKADASAMTEFGRQNMQAKIMDLEEKLEATNA